MSSGTFKALRITEDESEKFSRNIIERNIQDLPDGEARLTVIHEILDKYLNGDTKHELFDKIACDILDAFEQLEL